MSEILTREQLELYKLCVTDGGISCHECSLYKIKGGCAELVCNTALYWQDKAENGRLKERQKICTAALKHSTDVIRELQRRLEPLQGKAVLILGDMPEGCEDCLLSKWSEWRYEYFCFYTNEKCEGAGVAACPLRIVGGAEQ